MGQVTARVVSVITVIVVVTSMCIQAARARVVKSISPTLLLKSPKLSTYNLETTPHASWF